MRKTTINTDRGSGIEEEIDKVIMFDFYSVIFNCKKKKQSYVNSIYLILCSIAEIFSFY